MAETPAKAAAAPRTRTARPRAAAASKAAPAKKAPAATAKATPKAPEPFEKFAVDLVPNGATASYSKWAFPADVKCVGNVYAPLGTGAVRVLVVPAEEPAA